MERDEKQITEDASKKGKREKRKILKDRVEGGEVKGKGGRLPRTT